MQIVAIITLEDETIAELGVAQSGGQFFIDIIHNNRIMYSGIPAQTSFGRAINTIESIYEDGWDLKFLEQIWD